VGYAALRTQVKCDPRDIPQFRLKGLKYNFLPSDDLYQLSPLRHGSAYKISPP